MNIVALYKIYRGYEFLIPSIQSIYNYCDKIVFVSSEIGWDGKNGNNTESAVRDWAAKNDIFDKIVIIKCDTQSQSIQYETGLKYIREQFKADWILLIDSDEVWDTTAWSNAMDHLWRASPRTMGLTANMHTYIKDVIYRVDDSRGTQVKPTVFMRPSVKNMGTRGSGATPSVLMANVIIHHFALVRDSIEEVFRKMGTSRIGDRHLQPLVDLEQWKVEVWDKIPGPAYHYYTGCGVWQKTIEIDPRELPQTIKNVRGIK